MNLQMCLAGARLIRVALKSVHQTNQTETHKHKGAETCVHINSRLPCYPLAPRTYPFRFQNLPPPTISISFTCRESPGGRPSVAPDSWVSPYLYRSNQARLSACVALRSPHSGRGRRAAGGWTQGARGPGTASALCGSASCCRFHPCWGPPCCR